MALADHVAAVEYDARGQAPLDLGDRRDVARPRLQVLGPVAEIVRLEAALQELSRSKINLHIFISKNIMCADDGPQEDVVVGQDAGEAIHQGGMPGGEPVR